MKKIIYFLISLTLFFSNPITAYAKPRIDVVEHGGWVDLSDEDMQDTITALVSEISNDLQITTIII